jgi:methyl-accepting chemotaxis protein
MTMKWLHNLPTRAKLFLGFGLMIVFLATVIVTAYTGISAIQDAQKNLYEEDFANAVDLLTLRTNVNGVRAALLTMMLVTNRSDQESGREEFQDRRKTMDEIIPKLLERNRNSPQFLSQLEEFNVAWNAYKETQDTQVLPLINEGRIEAAQTIVLGIQFERYQTMRTISQNLGDEAEKAAQAAVTLSEQRANESVRIFVLLGVIALLLSGVMAVLLDRIIANPLKAVSGAAEGIATGDLTINIPLDGRTDEVGTLIKTFHRMVANLREVTGDTTEAVSVLAASASEILAATTQVAAGAAETATAVSETSTTVEEVRQAAQLSTRKAKDVSESSQKAAQVAQAGKSAVEDTITGMNRIREQMGAIAETIVRLSERSQAIGEIIASVNDLADQSNLLAVNAAIEAAKAGEYGKGFTVVAQEIKSLAEQSKQATAQVRTLLSDIQKMTGAAVLATEQGSKAVEAGVKQSAEAGEAIRLLTGSVTEAAQASLQIVASSQQQTVGMDQVALAMENINQASVQNVASTKQVETTAESLHELGQKLKQLVGRFKV